MKATPTTAHQGFVMTRHWRDTPEGVVISVWIRTEDGGMRVQTQPQEVVAFLPAEQQVLAQTLVRFQPGAQLRPLALEDFHHRPVVGLYCREYRTLGQLARRLKAIGVDVYEADVRPPDRYLMERFITAGVTARGERHADGSLHNARLMPLDGYRPPCAGHRWTSRPMPGATCTPSRLKAAASVRSTCWARRTVRRLPDAISGSSIGTAGVNCCSA
ncbi:hypothetical protein ACU8V3_14520 [Cobetia marina]